MRCLISGASGFIGSHLVHMLLEKGCQVGIITRTTSDLWRINNYLSKLFFIHGNLASPKDFEAGIKKFRPEVVIHAGWFGVEKKFRNTLEQVHNNLYGSLHLLEYSLDAGCKLWIGFGSQAEYGTTNERLVENMPAIPDSLYGAVKLSIGLLSQELCKQAGIRSAWLRLTAAYGPKDDLDHLIPYVISTLLEGKEPEIVSGEQKWDYLYIDDVVSAVWSLMNRVEGKGIYNLSSGKAIPIKTICEIIKSHINPKIRINYKLATQNNTSRNIMEADNNHLYNSIGWKPAVCLDDGLDQTTIWYRNKLLSH